MERICEDLRAVLVAEVPGVRCRTSYFTAEAFPLRAFISVDVGSDDEDGGKELIDVVLEVFRVKGGYRAEWCVAREPGEYVHPETSSAPFAEGNSAAALAAVMGGVAETVESSRSRIVAALRRGSD
jgi:hypothetical protein